MDRYIDHTKQMGDYADMNPKLSIYDNLGGAEGIRSLVEAFYPRVQQNELLSPLFPEDIMPVMEKQYMFLSQFFGGPALFSEAFGHPMMRARHMKFPITNLEFAKERVLMY